MGNAESGTEGPLDGTSGRGSTDSAPSRTSSGGGQPLNYQHTVPQRHQQYPDARHMPGPGYAYNANGEYMHNGQSAGRNDAFMYRRDGQGFDGGVPRPTNSHNGQGGPEAAYVDHLSGGYMDGRGGQPPFVDPSQYNQCYQGQQQWQHSPHAAQIYPHAGQQQMPWGSDRIAPDGRNASADGRRLKGPVAMAKAGLGSHFNLSNMEGRLPWNAAGGPASHSDDMKQAPSPSLAHHKSRYQVPQPSHLPGAEMTGTPLPAHSTHYALPQQQHKQLANRSDFRTAPKKKKQAPGANMGFGQPGFYDPATAGQMQNHQYERAMPRTPGAGGDNMHSMISPGSNVGRQQHGGPPRRVSSRNDDRTPRSVNVSVMYAAEPGSIESSRSNTPVDPNMYRHLQQSGYATHPYGEHHDQHGVPMYAATQHQGQSYNDPSYNKALATMQNLSIQQMQSQKQDNSYSPTQQQILLSHQQQHPHPHHIQQQHRPPEKNLLLPAAAAAAAEGSAAEQSDTDNEEEDDTAQWKNAWEEDDDSSADGGPDSPSASVNVKCLDMSHPFRPTMDGGHSSARPVKSADLLQFNSPARMMQQQQPATLTSEKIEFPSQASKEESRQHGATAQHHQAADEERSEEEVLSRQADQIIEANGITWDTSAESVTTDGETVHERPNVKMFFPLLRVLGKGSFGKVVLVRKRTGAECGGLFAMKILRKAHLVKRRQIERTKTERKVLAVADHPFIMKLHFAFQTNDKLYLVLDYCPGGELFFHLSRYRRFPERVARFYSAELLLAIDHLHKKGIIYRDLKPENVLLDAEGHVKLGDFGLAKDRIVHPCKGATSMCGTPEYMAPEVLSQAGHGFCVDYWGLGMLVYEMMTGLPPWYTTDRAKLFKKLKSAPLEVPSYFTPASTDYVKNLLERNQYRRLGVQGVEDVKRHPFFVHPPLNFEWLVQKRIDAPIRPCEGWKAPENSISGAGQNNGGEAWNSFANQNSSAMYNANGEVTGGLVGMNSLTGSDQRNMLHLDNMTIDAATANFDKAFTRLPVETEDHTPADQASGSASDDDLNVETFVGFTFDENVLEGVIPGKGR